MVWLYAKWQAFLHSKHSHPPMDFYDRLKEADDADRREAILYLAGCFVVFILTVVLFLFL
jgi:hypothetical protein